MTTWAWIGDVECRDRLVGHDQARVERERARDADALALAAGELVRIAVVVLRGEAHDLHQLLHARLDLAARLAVDHERLADQRPHALARIQRCVRILEDHLHLAAQRPQRAPVEIRDVAALEDDAPRGQLVQAHEAPPERRLATAGLADEAERLACPHLQRHVVDGLHASDLPADDASPLDREVLGHALGREQRLLAHDASSG